MTDTEIINRLISIMNVGQHHKFLDEWHKIPGIATESSGEMWTKDAKRILHLMTSKKIIRHIRNQDNNAIVELRDRGIKFKSEGGLKVDISKITGNIIKFSKAFWIFLIGFFTIVPGAIFTYDRFLKGGTSEPMEIQTDSTTVKEDKLTSPELTTDSLTKDLKTKKLIEAILNFPAVIKFSKTELLHKEYGKISIYFNQDSIAERMPAIFQNGRQLELLTNIDTIDTEKRPCYVFTKISITNNHAYAGLILDMTGFIAYGNLNYIDGHWTPDKEFRIGFK